MKISYFQPYIDSSGIHIPTYTDIVNQMVADAQNIFGADVYLGTDSQDYQWISSVASKINDSFLLAQSVYNARGPATALGTGLDVVVGINGITRKAAVYSTATVTLSGTSGTTVTNGIVADKNGNNWTLPVTVVLGSDGTTSVTATCQTSGAIVANPGDINTIVTPTLGWTSVNNASAATTGTPAETDSALRARQSVSTAQPSLNVLDGLKGAIAAVSSVTRYQVYENDTSSVDANGIPANSICAVVEGGAAADIAKAIFNKKGPGCGTYGSSSQAVTDSYGQSTTIKYDVVGYTAIDVSVSVKKLSGYNSNTTTAIQNAIVSYLNNLPIGSTVYYSSLWGAAMSANGLLSAPAFSITGLTSAVHLGTQLTSALVSGTAYTSISVQALTVAVKNGNTLVIGSGSTTQNITAGADAPVGSTSITASFTANAAYASGAPVAFTQAQSDIAIAFNYAAQGVAANVVVTAS